MGEKDPYLYFISIKTLLMWKWGILVAGFCTSHVWTRRCPCWFNQVNQVNSAVWMSSPDRATTHFWREGNHVVLETLLGGTQGEEDHKIYKEEDSRHWRLAYGLLILVCLDSWAFFSYWVSIQCWHSCLGIPSPSLSDILEEFHCSFYTYELVAKHPPSATELFL